MDMLWNSSENSIGVFMCFLCYGLEKKLMSRVASYFVDSAVESVGISPRSEKAHTASCITSRRVILSTMTSEDSSPENGLRHKCSSCRKTFKNQNHLRRHELSRECIVLQRSHASRE